MSTLQMRKVKFRETHAQSHSASEQRAELGPPPCQSPKLGPRVRTVTTKEPARASGSGRERGGGGSLSAALTGSQTGSWTGAGGSRWVTGRMTAVAITALLA